MVSLLGRKEKKMKPRMRFLLPPTFLDVSVKSKHAAWVGAL